MVKAMEKRVAAAINLGFTKVVAPVGAKAAVAQSLRKHVVETRHVTDLVHIVRGKRTRMSRGGKAKAARSEADTTAESSSDEL